MWLNDHLCGNLRFVPDKFGRWSALSKAEFLKMRIQRRYLCGPFVAIITLETLLHFLNFACMGSILSLLYIKKCCQNLC